jgi:hypothetical protein
MATNGQHETFPIPTPNPADALKSSAASWPKSAMTSGRIENTTLEAVRKNAAAQSELAAADAANRLGQFRMVDVGSAATKKGGR